MYGREIDGRVVSFGTSGYTKDNVFVLYDRDTESVWYPLSDNTMDAVSGPRRGRSIPFLDQPERMPLAKWRALHPDTTVLLPPPSPRDDAAHNANGNVQ